MQNNPELNVQSGEPIHVFNFKNGADNLTFTVPAKNPHEAADKLEKMLHDLIIQIRMQYPKIVDEHVKS